MPVLTSQQRSEVWAAIMREIQEVGIPQGILKSELRAAVDACDQWVEDNQSSFNTALPQPFRGAANVEQKILLLHYVLERRRQKIGGP